MVRDKSLVEKIDAAKSFLAERSPTSPEIAIVLGTGMSDCVSGFEGVSLPYEQIPGFLSPTVPTHAGKLLLGQHCGRDVAIMQGRLHRYEGHSSADVVFPIRVLSALGVRKILFTNAAGALADGLEVGDLCLVEDHVSLANLAGEDPSRFAYDESIGPRFVSLNGVYSSRMITLAESILDKGDVTYRRGVYAYVSGPSFETPAEIRLLKLLGADVVGMSTVPEVLAAAQAGMEIAAFSVITNVAVDSVDDDYVTNAEDIFTALKNIAPVVQDCLSELLPSL